MFKENFIKLCNQKGVAPTVVCQSVGLSNAIFSQWEDTSVPRKATLKKIADYFDVSVDYLLGTEPKTPEPDTKSNVVFLEKQNVYMIPIFENVSAGLGSIANGEVSDYMPLYIANPYEAKETLCIKVIGDSMYPKIEDGDIIQVHKQNSVDSGSIAVILLDGDEGLVKKIIYGKDWVELLSFNPMYKPLRFVGPEILRLKIVGLVKKIIKNV